MVWFKYFNTPETKDHEYSCVAFDGQYLPNSTVPYRNSVPPNDVTFILNMSVYSSLTLVFPFF